MFDNVLAKFKCPICGNKINSHSDQKLKNVKLCDSCNNKFTPLVDCKKINTVEDVQRYFAYREENLNEIRCFEPSYSIGEKDRLSIDEKKKCFMIKYSGKDMSSYSDVIKMASVMNCEFEIKETKRKTGANSLTYTFYYNFKIKMELLHPWISKIDFKLNSNPIKILATFKSGEPVVAPEIKDEQYYYYEKIGNETISKLKELCGMAKLQENDYNVVEELDGESVLVPPSVVEVVKQEERIELQEDSVETKEKFEVDEKDLGKNVIDDEMNIGRAKPDNVFLVDEKGTITLEETRSILETNPREEGYNPFDYQAAFKKTAQKKKNNKIISRVQKIAKTAVPLKNIIPQEKAKQIAANAQKVVKTGVPVKINEQYGKTRQVVTNAKKTVKTIANKNRSDISKAKSSVQPLKTDNDKKVSSAEVSTNDSKKVMSPEFIVMMVFLYCALALFIIVQNRNDGADDQYSNAYENNIEQYDWETLVLKDKLPKPLTECGQIKKNTSQVAELDIFETTQEDYQQYAQQCKSVGFALDENIVDSGVEVYDNTGFYLVLTYNEYDETMTIVLKENIKLVEMQWSESEIVKLLPRLTVSLGKVEKDEDTVYEIYVGKMTSNVYDAYVKQCIDNGFDVDVVREETVFTAKKDIYAVSVELLKGNIMHISIEEDARKYEWQEIVLNSKLPQPPTVLGEIKQDSETHLQMDIFECSQEQYEAYIEQCNGMGYNLDFVRTDNSVEVYDDNGFVLIMNYVVDSETLSLELKESIKLEEIQWSENAVAKILPKLEVSVGKIVKDEAHVYEIYVGKISQEAYEKYVKSCVENKFDTDKKQEDRKFSAKNGVYSLAVELNNGNVMHISVTEGKIKMYSPDGKTVDIHTAEAEGYKEKGWYAEPVMYMYSEDGEQIVINKSEVEKYEKDGWHKQVPMAKVPYSDYDVEYENYKDVVTAMEKAGFKNIEVKVVYDVGTGWIAKLSRYEVSSMTIGESNDYDEGDEFLKKTKVVITYRDYEILDPNIKYSSYKVSTILNDVEKNALNAAEKYRGRYLEIEGYVDDIDSSGNFSLYATNSQWEYIGIECTIANIEEHKNAVRAFESGDKIKVKGRLTILNEWGGSLSVYRFD